MKLRGACKYSYLDKIYQIKYDPENIITYVGNEKSIIAFDFTSNVWKIRKRVGHGAFRNVSEAACILMPLLLAILYCLHKDEKLNELFLSLFQISDVK